MRLISAVSGVQIPAPPPNFFLVRSDNQEPHRLIGSCLVKIPLGQGTRIKVDDFVHCRSLSSRTTLSLPFRMRDILLRRSRCDGMGLFFPICVKRAIASPRRVIITPPSSASKRSRCDNSWRDPRMVSFFISRPPPDYSSDLSGKFICSYSMFQCRTDCRALQPLPY